MSFVNPFFLFALAAVSLPIIIHLFHFRRFKKVYFSNISFLEKLDQETQKQARLKHLLVLLARILAIIFLVFAFARPYIPFSDNELRADGNHVSIFIDNSFSMEASSVYGSLLDHALMSAEEIALAFDATDRFQILTNDFEARHQRFVSREEFFAGLSEIRLSPSVRNLSDIMKRQAGSLRNESVQSNHYSFVLSDFQKSIADIDQIEKDTMVDFLFVPFQAQQPGNVFIDSLWIENPVRLRGQSVTIHVKIYNDSDEKLETQPLRLFINGRQRTIATYDVAPRSGIVVELTYTIDNNTVQEGWVEIIDYPVVFDNQMFFSFNVSDNIPVLAINQDGENRFLNALLGQDSTFIFRNMNVSAVDYSVFGIQNLIILNGLREIRPGLALELKRFTEVGGSILVFPGEQIDYSSYRGFLTSLDVTSYSRLDTTSLRVTSLNELHPIYSGVFEHMPENINLPSVNQYYVIERITRGKEEYLMQLQNGEHFFVSSDAGMGKVYLSSVPANDRFSNFPRHAMFVPTLYNIALFSHSLSPVYYTLGPDLSISFRERSPLSTEFFRVLGKNTEVIPETRTVSGNLMLFLHDQLHESGNYRLLRAADTLAGVSLNYDRKESYLESYSVSEIESLVSRYGLTNTFTLEPDRVSFEKQMEMLKGGTQLWRLFVLLALLCLFAEVLLIRFLK